MGTQVRWQDYPTAVTYMTTELNSLGDASNKLGDEIDNREDGYIYMDVELLLQSIASARDTGAYVALYILPSVDGTNYCYGGDSTDPPANSLAATLEFPADTSTARNIATHLLVPAGKFRMLVINETGQTFAAGANQLKYVLYGEIIE